MSAPPLKSLEDRLRTAAGQVERDLRRLVSYVNDEVVPDVRRNGSVALRTAATELERLARHIDDARGPAAPPPAPKHEP